MQGAWRIGATKCVANPSAELNTPGAAAVECAGAGRLPFPFQQIFIGLFQGGAVAVSIRVLLHCIGTIRSLVAVVGDPGAVVHVFHDYRIITQQDFAVMVRSFCIAGVGTDHFRVGVAHGYLLVRAGVLCVAAPYAIRLRTKKRIKSGTVMTMLEQIADALRAARHVVVLTGAGVSAESGIPTFRDPLTGLWQRFDPGQLASARAFLQSPALVWGWYEWRRMKVMQAQPNPAHLSLARLAELVPQLTLITQNVDDLHERAGSVDVIHLHGNLQQPRCFACARMPREPLGVPEEPEGGRELEPPRCQHCGGRLRPGVVWFGESLPAAALKQAFTAAGACDLLLVVGTAGVVYPAAKLPEITRQSGGGSCTSIRTSRWKVVNGGLQERRRRFCRY